MSVFLSVCLFVSLQNTNFSVDWTLLVKECIANIDLPLGYWLIEEEGGVEITLLVIQIK